MKKYIFLFVMLSSSLFVFSQNSDNEYGEENIEEETFVGLKEEKKKLDLSKFRVGGDFGFSLGSNNSGNNIVYAEISPTIGYQIVEDRIEVGPGLIYQHFSATGVYSENNIGGQAYVRAYIWQGLFAQVDGFLVNVNLKDVTRGRTASFTYGNGFAGAGYAFNHTTAPIYFSISAKVNLVTDQFYPTRRIIPKVGFQVRL